jgi:uncharacterized membrane protein
MTLETDKSLGGVGAILLVIGTIPFAGFYTGILAIVGLILVLISLKGLSSYYSESGIFNNALYAFIIAIVGGIVSIVAIVTAAIGFLDKIGFHPSNWTDPTVWRNFNWSNISWDTVSPYIAAIVLSLVMLFVFAIVTAIFLRRSLNSLSSKSGVGMFGTARLMILIGAVLTIILVGFIILWVAMILLAVAFFSIKTQAAQPTAPGPPPAQR